MIGSHPVLLFMQAPIEAAAAISEQLLALVKASLARREAKQAAFEGEGTWDDEDDEVLEEEIAPEEVTTTRPASLLKYLVMRLRRTRNREPVVSCSRSQPCAAACGRRS